MVCDASYPSILSYKEPVQLPSSLASWLWSVSHTSELVALPQSHRSHVVHGSMLLSAVCHPWQTTFWSGEELC